MDTLDIAFLAGMLVLVFCVSYAVFWLTQPTPVPVPVEMPGSKRATPGSKCATCGGPYARRDT